MMNRAEQNWPDGESIEVTDNQDAVQYVQDVIATNSVFEPLYLEVL